MTDTRWLDDEERSTWLGLTGIVTLLPAALDAQLQRDAGMTYFDYMVMAVLSENPDRTLRLSDLATGTNSSLSRLSHVVTKLESRGWVRRESNPGDKRASDAVLTPDGYAVVVATAPAHVEAVRSWVFDALSREQVEQLHAISEAIVARLDPHDRLAALIKLSHAGD